MELLELVLSLSALPMMVCKAFCSAIRLFSQVMPGSTVVMHRPSKCKDVYRESLGPNSVRLVLMALELSEDSPCGF